MSYNLSFSCVHCGFGVTSKNSLLNPRSQRFSPMFSSESCVMVNFGIYVRQGSKFILLQRYSVVSVPFVERPSVPTEMTWCMDWKLMKSCMWVSFWTCTSVPLICMPVLLLVPHGLEYSSSVDSSEIEKCESSSFVLLLKVVLAVLGPLHFWSLAGVLTGIVVNV